MPVRSLVSGVVFCLIAGQAFADLTIEEVAALMEELAE